MLSRRKKILPPSWTKANVRSQKKEKYILFHNNKNMGKTSKKRVKIYIQNKKKLQAVQILSFCYFKSSRQKHAFF